MRTRLPLFLALSLAALTLAARPARAQSLAGSHPGGYTPYFSVAVSSGLGMYSRGLGEASYTGPTWGARLGVEMLPFLVLEARYLGSYHGTRADRVGPDVGLLTEGAAGTVRVQLPGARFVPYLFGGVGLYGTAVVGAGASAQSQPLRSTLSVALPVGAGGSYVIDRHWSVDLEFAWHALLSDHYATTPAYASADLWTFDAGVRYGF